MSKPTNINGLFMLLRSQMAFKLKKKKKNTRESFYNTHITPAYPND